MHVVLLGDSIFDNAHYVPGGPSVTEQLQRCLGHSSRVTLLARDGAGVENIANQFARLPDDVEYLVLSIGGNNALEHSSLIRSEPAESVAESLTILHGIWQQFQHEYRAMLRPVLQRRLPTLLCTIYEQCPGLTPAEQTGLCLFNDVIIREGFRYQLPVIDLRLLCTEPTDYSPLSPIEPSVQGGHKITRAIADRLRSLSGTPLE